MALPGHKMQIQGRSKALSDFLKDKLNRAEKEECTSQ